MFDFTEVYESWTPEEFDIGDAEEIPPPSGWAADLLWTLGFELRAYGPAGRQGEAWHDGLTVAFWQEFDGHRSVRHELAHAVVWIAHGRPGGPQQWGIGTYSFGPKNLLDRLELLVFAVEWVLEERYGSRENMRSVFALLADGFDEEVMTTDMVLEAMQIVQHVLPEGVQLDDAAA